jgi:hypothetical protein
VAVYICIFCVHVQHVNTPTHQRKFDVPERMEGARVQILQMEKQEVLLRAWHIVSEREAHVTVHAWAAGA